MQRWDASIWFMIAAGIFAALSLLALLLVYGPQLGTQPVSIAVDGGQARCVKHLIQPSCTPALGCHCRNSLEGDTS
jgi:hypothetical protein